MRKNYFFKNILFFALCSLLSFQAFSQVFNNGVFVLNEGGTGGGASVSYIATGAATATNNIYATANPTQTDMGIIGQSIGFEGNYAYIVLNISNTVKVVNRTTFEHVATITGFENPRYVAFYDGKAYVTNWGGSSLTDDHVAIIDLQTNTITGTIPVEAGVERIITHNDRLYVAHQGGFSTSDKLTIINPATNTVEDVITVGDVPNKMVVKNGYLYVLCGGIPYWYPNASDGSLVKVDLADNIVTETIPFTGLNPANLEIDANDNIYFTADADVYKATLGNPGTYTEIASLSPQGAYGIYGMNLIDDMLYVADAGNYVTAGKAYVFTTAGVLQNTYTVGVVPNSFYKAEGTMSAPEYDSYQITLYPNPATDRFFLNTDKQPEIALYDVTGKEVLKTKYTDAGIGVASLPQGIYMVKIADEAAITVKKLVIK